MLQLHDEMNVGLSKDVQRFLDGICFCSSFVRTEGGMSYEHCLGDFGDTERVAINLRERLPTVTRSNFDFTSYDQTLKLTKFLNGALGHSLEIPSKYLPFTTVNEGFLGHLNAHLTADWFTANLVKCDFGMDIELLIVREKDKTVHVFRLAWRND